LPGINELNSLSQSIAVDVTYLASKSASTNIAGIPNFGKERARPTPIEL
jgi:hypothetical protein